MARGVGLDQRPELWARWVARGRYRAGATPLYRLVRDGVVVQANGQGDYAQDSLEMETDAAIAALMQCYSETVGRALLARLYSHDVIYSEPKLDRVSGAEKARRLGVSCRAYYDYVRMARAWLSGWFGT